MPVTIHTDKDLHILITPCSTLLLTQVILYGVINNDGSMNTTVSQASVLVHLKLLLIQKVIALTEGADGIVPAEIMLCFGDVALKGEACG